MNAVVFAMAIEELMQGPTTRAELAQHTGLSWHTMNLFVTTLHRRGLIHIAAWERDGRGAYQVAAFQFGRKSDAPKPPPQTPAAIMRAHRERASRQAALRASAGACVQATQGAA